jgi:hypothetical protein
MKLKHILFALTLCCVTACGSKTAMRNQPAGSIPVPTASAPVTKNAAPDAKPRLLVVLLDSSQSYELYEKAISKLLSIVKALGPSDQLIIAQVAGKFRPETNIRLQAKFPELPPQLLLPIRRLVDLGKKQAELDAIWRQVEKRRHEITIYVSERLVGKNDGVVTDLHGALDYCAQRLHQDNASEKYLIIFSDLEHDFERQKTSRPPARQMNFAGVRVRLLYLPWSDDWTGRQKEWATWFNRAGATDFLMLDAGQSEQEPVVALVPKPQLPSPFK